MLALCNIFLYFEIKDTSTEWPNVIQCYKDRIMANGGFTSV